MSTSVQTDPRTLLSHVLAVAGSTAVQARAELLLASALAHSGTVRPLCTYSMASRPTTGRSAPEDWGGAAAT